MDLVNQLGIDFAFPTRTLVIEAPPEESLPVARGPKSAPSRPPLSAVPSPATRHTQMLRTVTLSGRREAAQNGRRARPLFEPYPLPSQRGMVTERKSLRGKYETVVPLYQSGLGLGTVGGMCSYADPSARAQPTVDTDAQGVLAAMSTISAA